MDKLTSFDNRPSIAALQKVEQDILLLLDIASQTCTELSVVSPESKGKIEKLSREFVAHVKVQRISLDVPYQNTIYGAKKEAEIGYMMSQVVHNELRGISEYLGDKGPSLPVQEEGLEMVPLVAEVKEEEIDFIEIS